MISSHTVTNPGTSNPFMGEAESVRTARTALGHYFAMAHGISINAQLCLDKVRDRFWKRLKCLALVVLTLVWGAMIIPYMGKWQVLFPTSLFCMNALLVLIYMNNSLTDHMRPTNVERGVAKKWRYFLKIADHLELSHTLAEKIRSELDLDTQTMIQSGNQFGNPWFREKIRGVLRKMIEDHVQYVIDGYHDDEPDVAQRLHSRLLNMTRAASEMLGIEYNRSEYR